MNQMTLAEIKTRIHDAAGRIGASEQMLPTFGYSEESGRPHIEVDERGYHYVISVVHPSELDTRGRV